MGLLSFFFFSMTAKEMTTVALVLFAGGVLSYFFLPGVDNFLPTPAIAPHKHVYVLHVYTMSRCGACDELAAALQSPEMADELTNWSIVVHKDTPDEARALGVQYFPTVMAEIDGLYESKQDGFYGTPRLLQWLRDIRYHDFLDL